MTTQPSNLITVGRITGVFGIKGWLKVKSWTDPEEQIVNYAPWWLKTPHGARKVEVIDYLFRPQGLLVHLKGISDRNGAEEMARVDVAVEGSQLPELRSGEYYWHQLVGLEVVSCFAGEKYSFGRVASLMETGANDVLVVKPEKTSLDDRERLVPYVPGVYVKQVSIEAQIITVEWDPDF